MSDIQFIDVDDEQYEDSPRALREHVKKIQKALQAATAERDDYKGKWQAKSANDALAGFGFKNPKRVSRDLITDGVDITDTDAVKAWVAENGDDYAKGEGTNQPVQENAHQQEADARSKIADAASQTTVAPTDKMQAALAEIGDNATPAEVAAIFRKHGI